MKSQNIFSFEKLKKIFFSYLEEKDFRKTPERLAILKEVYNTEDHFDIDTLYLKMKQNKYRVSKATIYNTINLLVECNLVIQHKFGKNSSVYEKSFEYRQHDHFIDIETGNVLEFCDPRIQEIIVSVEKTLGVKVAYHSLNLYGSINE